MKKLALKVVLGMLLGSLLGGSALAQARIATLDMKKVFDKYYKTEQARASIEERKVEMEKEHVTYLNDYNKAKEDYQSTLAGANDQAVSAEERDKRKQLAEDKLKRVRDAESAVVEYERRARETLTELIERMKVRVLAEIRSMVELKAKEAGYALVLDTGDSPDPNNTPVVLYTNHENDMTQVVLDELNASAPPKTAKTDDSPPDAREGKKK